MPVNIPVAGDVFKSPFSAQSSALALQKGHISRPQVETHKPNLKRKRSFSRDSSQPETREMTDNLPSPSQHLDDVGPEQKRTKLGYHRTSIACGHCRHRKIRCLVSAGDESCTNCIRLKKDCFFHPVEPSQIKSKPRGKRSSSQLEKRRTLPIHSEEPPAQEVKKRYSDSAVPYSTASRGLTSLDFNQSGLIFEEPKAVSESTLENYNSLLDPGFGLGIPSFPVVQPCDEPHDSYGTSYSRHSISVPEVSPRTQYQGLSPSPHPDFNQQLAVPSPRITFTSDLNTPDWDKSLPSSSYDSVSNHQAMLSPRGTTQRMSHSMPHLDVTGMKSHLMPDASEYASLFSSEEMQVPLSAISSLSVPALSISQSASPFSDQNPWSGLTSQGNNPIIQGKAFDNYISESHWFPFQ